MNEDYRQMDIEAARRAGKKLATEVQVMTVSIVIGHEHGERDLITATDVAKLRQAADLLESRVLGGAS